MLSRGRNHLSLRNYYIFKATHWQLIAN